MSRIEYDGPPLRQREPRVRDKAHLGRVARLPCLACAVRGRVTRGVHVAHCRTAYPLDGWRDVGKSEKPSDVRCTPLCPPCHLYGPDAQHKQNEREFWEGLGVHPPDFCRDLVAAFALGENGDAVVYKYAAAARAKLARDAGR